MKTAVFWDVMQRGLVDTPYLQKNLLPQFSG
jgi:hypothetical protein